MGMGPGALKFCVTALDMGGPARSVCTLGRSNLFATPREVAGLLRQHGRLPPDFGERYPTNQPVAFADDVFRALGFDTIDSVDNSAYEGASVVHDMNRPIPEELRSRYDLVYDGGTLEHVFNFPTGLANAMRMVRPGGNLVLNTPANNQCGHGFYQFSPELFFRVFVPDNGYELLRLYLVYRGRFYHVVDPALVHGRVQLLAPDGAMLLVHARRLSDVEPFTRPPQQSDYVAAWQDHAGAPPKQDGRLKRILRARLSEDRVQAISRQLNRVRQWRAVRRWRYTARITNRRFYVPVDRWDVSTASVTGSPARSLVAAT